MTHEKKVSSRMDFRVDSEMEGDLWGTDDEIWGRVTASLAALDAKRKDKKRQKQGSVKLHSYCRRVPDSVAACEAQGVRSASA